MANQNNNNPSTTNITDQANGTVLIDNWSTPQEAIRPINELAILQRQNVDPNADYEVIRDASTNTHVRVLATRPSQTNYLADWVWDTRTGSIGTINSSIYAVRDHIHPIIRLAQVTAPVPTAWWFFTLASTSVNRQYTTEETQNYSIRVNVTTNGVGTRGTITIPNLAGYQLVSVQFANPYDPTGSSLAYNVRPPFVRVLNTIYAQTLVTGRTLTFDIDLTYILN